MDVIVTAAGFQRAGINPTLTGQVSSVLVKAGFTPARIDGRTLQIVQFGNELNEIS
jgi:hypothetical protein